MNRESMQNKTESVGLFISLLVRYPEISSINYEPSAKVLQLSFVVKEVVDSERQIVLQELITSYLAGHAQLIKLSPEEITVKLQSVEKCTFIEISRDVDTITKEEISLLVELLNDCFPTQLIADTKDQSLEEDQDDQEDLISYMLDNFRVLAQAKKYFAYRENGRVLVFNK